VNIAVKKMVRGVFNTIVPARDNRACHCRRGVAVFLLLLEQPKSDKNIQKTFHQQTANPDFSRIRCPLCKWQPKSSHRWFCAPCVYPEFFDGGCGECWNTFSTRGRCAGCGHQWRWTACLNCSGWSPHEHWYEIESKN
jgi:hypothetical protein